MKPTGKRSLVLLGVLGGLLGCGEKDRSLGILTDSLHFQGQVIVPEGLLETNPSTTYVQGGTIVPPGTDPLVAACTVRFGGPSTSTPVPLDTYVVGQLEYTYPSARVVVLRATRTLEEMDVDEAAGRPGMLAGDFWGIGPETQTEPCFTQTAGVCYYGGYFDPPVTLEVFPGCPAGVGPTPR